MDTDAKALIGVLGGMGPAATIDFMSKVRAATSAKRDQDHVPLLVHCVPQIPDRVSAIANGTDAPCKPLLEGARLLERAGVRAIVIPCNTAHHWHAQLSAEIGVPILHIVDAVREQLSARQRPGQRIALMGTQGTRMSGMYDALISADAGELVLPDANAQSAIDLAIGCVKVGDLANARSHATRAVELLIGTQRADLLLLACTELPIALQDCVDADLCIDATHALAQACVRFSLGFFTTNEGVSS